MVGTDRRVLDIGCGDGALGRVLKARGCWVAGVEADPAQADAARPALDDVLVGAVGDLDLPGHFADQPFDVVVLAGVLPRLADPVGTLTLVKSLLTPTGAVLLSVPNADHGSVRLALLEEGPWDESLGRLYTLAAVHDVLHEAGLHVTDVRRTTAGVFATDLPFRREEFERGDVDAIEGDPASTTYQFVVRAVAGPSVDVAPADGSTAPRPIGRPVRLGIWSAASPADVRSCLHVRVAAAELSDRLPDAVIRPFTVGGGSPPGTDLGGWSLEHVGEWSPGRAAELAEQLDGFVVADRLAWTAVEEIGTAVLGGDRSDESLAAPDPLLLVPRLLPPEVLADRRQFARMVGWFPHGGRAVVVEVDAGVAPAAEDFGRRLGRALSHTDATAILVPFHRDDPDVAAAVLAVAGALDARALVVGDEAGADDLVGLVAGADAVVARSPTVLGLALAYGIPVAVLAGGAVPPDHSLLAAAGPGSLVADIADVAELPDNPRFAPGISRVAQWQAALDASLDRIAALAAERAEARTGGDGPRPVLPPEYVAALEQAQASMRRRLWTERRAVARHLDRLQDEVDRLRRSNRAVESRLAETALELAGARLEASGARAELEALRRTRILRLLRPARAAYARLRGSRL